MCTETINHTSKKMSTNKFLNRTKEEKKGKLVIKISMMMIFVPNLSMTNKKHTYINLKRECKV